MRQGCRLGVALIVSWLSVGPAVAGTLTVTGIISPTDPTMPVVSISTPNCIGQGITPVHYEALPFTVSASGAYTVALTSSPSNAASFYLHEIAFDPNNGLMNCIAGPTAGRRRWSPRR